MVAIEEPDCDHENIEAEETHTSFGAAVWGICQDCGYEQGYPIGRTI